MKNGNLHHGFTLIELLVTMGLMAMLATVSIAGYYSAVRGMTERGVRQDVISFVRLAQQRALVEQTPTSIYLMNRMFRTEDEDMGEAAYVAGIAVRMAGRISCISKSGDNGGGIYLIDEYADLDKTYPTNAVGKSIQGKGRTGMRIYRMGANIRSAKAGYSVVHDRVIRAKLDTNLEDLLVSEGKDAAGTFQFDSSSVNDAIRTAWGFQVNNKIDNDARGGADNDWRVGDPYGVEIATLQLPHGYVFGTVSDVPREIGVTKDVGKPMFFDPAVISADKYKGSDIKNFQNITISAFRPDRGGASMEQITTITSNSLNDDSD